MTMVGQGLVHKLLEDNRGADRDSSQDALDDLDDDCSFRSVV